MKRFFLFMLLASCLCVQAQTIQVGGLQSGTWDADTVLVVDNVTVFGSLNVMPGTVVLLDGFYSIEVGNGASFTACGTESDSIVFTVADTTDFYKYGAEYGGWNGFQLRKAGSFLLDYCILEYGKAFPQGSWFGGVLDITSCEDVKIFHSTLRHSVAHERGGAIFALDSQVQMRGCAINDNTVYNEENMYIYGGGACFLRSDVEMSEMEFRGNRAPTIGGALSFDSCSVMLDRSIFVDNMGVNGGGLYLMRSEDKKCRMSNLLFDDNYSAHFGGGFAVADASPEIYNVLVTNNSSEGVSCNGVFFYGHCSSRLTNCIIYGNYPPEESQHIDTAQMWVWTMDEYVPEFYNCLIEGGLKYIHSGEMIQVFENIIDADPMFVDAEHHDFRLQEGSPCRDAGLKETPDIIINGLDLGGQPRVSNQRIDIGPYEYSGTTVSEQAAAPFARIVGNPLGTNSRIELDKAVKGEVTVSFYDLTGRCGASQTFDGEETRNLAIGSMVERLTSGVYLVEVRNDKEVCTLKAVK
ncbi:MAG: right-handed parallel beta-helix repeat-containing protein [Bacteroidales bacterium]|nr:right-handed parallel beta-helix repeat-containing protein [Bacteroidales bacterium]